jgi:hypothetical protein
LQLAHCHWYVDKDLFFDQETILFENCLFQ